MSTDPLTSKSTETLDKLFEYVHIIVNNDESLANNEEICSEDLAFVSYHGIDDFRSITPEDAMILVVYILYIKKRGLIYLEFSEYICLNVDAFLMLNGFSLLLSHLVHFMANQEEIDHCLQLMQKLLQYGKLF